MSKYSRLAKPWIWMILFFMLFFSCNQENRISESRDRPAAEKPVFPKLDEEAASRFARLALNCLKKEYPNKLDHVMNDGSEVRNPAFLHPAFRGCFDWHSAVHGHWMLIRLLKNFPRLAEAGEIRAALNENLSVENIETEVRYLQQPGRESFERTYGWAWLLKLAEELHGWDDPDGRNWSRILQPLAGAIADRYSAFLPKQTYPIRRGVHPNTAFGIAFALDYARKTGNKAFEELLIERSMAYFYHDAGCPAAWEPDGDDFFSPCLMEADLMRRVLKPQEFVKWFRAFLPDIASGEPESLLQPAVVSDRSDPKIVHLDGLNLSRAWCMDGIAESLPRNDPAGQILKESAIRLGETALHHIESGEYAGEHWLATFAVYMLSGNQ